MKKKLDVNCRRIFLLAIILPALLSAITTANAQTNNEFIVNGKVVAGNDAKPLAGVSIKETGTSNGVATNSEGQFTIKVKKANAILEFSFTGFQSQKVNVNNRQSLNVTLNLKQGDDLDEVVVVGYGTQKKVNLTGAVSTLSFKDLQNTPQANTLNILSGRVSGVSVVQPGGQPGSDNPEVLVRGIGTIGDASPLVIIDGALATLGDVGRLTPQEIADISVLKDASSTAIYGARGANGVILVTTKTPGQGKIKMNFSAYYGLQKGTYLPKFVEAWQYLVLHGEATGTRSPSQLSAIERLKQGIYDDTASNTNWVKEVYRTAPIANYNLSLSGGSNNVSFQGSLGYLKQQGIMRGTDGERFNMRTNVKIKPSKNIEAGINLWAYKDKANEPFGGVANIVTSINRAAPNTPVKYSNGSWGVYDYLNGTNAIGIQINPLLYTETGYTRDNGVKANLQTYVEVALLKNLKARTAINYTYGSSTRERFNPTYDYPNLAGLSALSNPNNVLANSNNIQNQTQIQTTLTYKKVFGKLHQFGALAGHEYTTSKVDAFNATGQNIPTNETPVLSNVITNIAAGGSKSEWRLQSFFGRVNYVFNDKYLLEGNLRADGSSRFPTDNKYGYFPSFSAGWIISKEDFFNSLFKNNNNFSLLKIRGGWGKVGNDRIGNYPYQQTFTTNSNYNYNGTLAGGGAVTDFANSQIKWESTTSTNYGIDAGFFKNKLTINYDIYKKLTDGILYRLPIAPSYGVVLAPVVNVGEISNKGWDLQAAYRNQTKTKLNYNIGFNVSYVKNRVEKLSARESISGGTSGSVNILLREGEALNTYYGYEFEGLYRTAEDLTKYPAYTTIGLAPGAMRFRDVNNDGKINADDRVIIGNGNTPYTFGITGGAGFKGFDMNFLLQGVKGKSIYLNDFGNRAGSQVYLNFWKEWWDNRFSATDNPEGTWPSLRRQSVESTVSSTFWLKDASYMRLKNIEIGYNLQPSLLKHLKISGLRFYASGQNLLTFTSLIKQVDPERPTVVSAVSPNQNYPQVKIITFGVNASF